MYSRFFKATFLLVLALVLLGCKSKYEDCTEEDYNNCNPSRPSVGEAEILVTINDENPEVTLALFEGDFEDGNLVWEKELNYEQHTELLKVEKYYSFVVTYQKDQQTIVAVDGGAVGVERYTMCEYTCYEVKPLSIDCALK